MITKKLYLRAIKNIDGFPSDDWRSNDLRAKQFGMGLGLEKLWRAGESSEPATSRNKWVLLTTTAHVPCTVIAHNQSFFFVLATDLFLIAHN